MKTNWFIFLLCLLFTGCVMPTAGVCPECQGNGVVVYERGDPVVDFAGVAPGVYGCPTCEGSGVLLQE